MARTTVKFDKDAIKYLKTVLEYSSKEYEFSNKLGYEADLVDMAEVVESLFGFVCYELGLTKYGRCFGHIENTEQLKDRYKECLEEIKKLDK